MNKKKLCELTIDNILNTCDRYKDCTAVCPFYMRKGFPVKGAVKVTHCKGNFEYIQKHPNEEVELGRN